MFRDEEYQQLREDLCEDNHEEPIPSLDEFLDDEDDEDADDEYEYRHPYLTTASSLLTITITPLRLVTLTQLAGVSL